MYSIDPTHYQSQLQEKTARLQADFSGFNPPPLDVFPSPEKHFRMRAEFRIWHQGGTAHYAMTPPGERRPQPIEGFPIGSTLINTLMPPLLQAINNNPVLRRKLYAVEFLTTLSGEALVTLIYHKTLDDDWRKEAELLKSGLNNDRGTGRIVGLIGRSRKQKVVLGRDYVTETLTVAGHNYRYQQVETGFTQPNARVNEKMLGWALEQTKNATGDLLELYCGNGNFTLVLAQNFHQVLATEVAKLSVNSALYNLQNNAVNNVSLVRMSSEELTQAFNKVRPFRRLKDIDLDSYHFSTVFVDPPRAGLDEDTLALVKRFARIIYISCNPVTLKANLAQLNGSHKISAFALFDQFPYTQHTECGLALTANQ